MRISDWISDVCSSDLSVYVPFFGKPAHSLTSTHQLARMSGAAVVLFQHARRADGGYSLKLQPALADLHSKRTEARREGKECVSTRRYRWEPYHSKKKHLHTSLKHNTLQELINT